MKAKRILKLKRARAAAKEAPRRNGRIVQEDPRKVVMQQPHRRMYRDQKQARSQEAENVFGRLMLSKEISEAQYEAGVWWLESYIAFARVKGIPLGRLRGTLAQTIRGHDNSDIAPSQAKAVVDKFARISAALLDHLGMGAQEARDVLVNTIVHDKLPTPWSLGVMREALNIIGKAKA